MQVHYSRRNGKIDNILDLISNQALQEKINLNVMYEDYSSHKDLIQKYMKKGYNFTITIDSSLKDPEEIDKLKIFKFIVVPKRLELYNKIIKKKTILPNIITL